MKYFENKTYTFGGLATNKSIEIPGVILEEYLAESSHGHTVRELWGPGVLASILLHEMEGDDLERAEWDLVSRTLVAVMNGNCPSDEALAIQGFVAELVADVYEYYSNLDEYDNAYGHYYLFNSYEETIDWAVCELAHICLDSLKSILGGGKWSIQMSDFRAEMVTGEFVLLEPVSWQSNRQRDDRLVVVPPSTTPRALMVTKQVIGSL